MLMVCRLVWTAVCAPAPVRLQKVPWVGEEFGLFHQGLKPSVMVLEMCLKRFDAESPGQHLAGKERGVAQSERSLSYEES